MNYDIFYNKTFFNQFYENKNWVYNDNLLPRQRIITTYGDTYLRNEDLKPWTPDPATEYTFPMEVLYLCPKCIKNKELIKYLQNCSMKVSFATYRFWNRENQIRTVYIINPETGEKFRFPNLKAGTIEELRETELHKKF